MCTRSGHTRLIGLGAERALYIFGHILQLLLQEVILLISFSLGNLTDCTHYAKVTNHIRENITGHWNDHHKKNHFYFGDMYRLS